MLDESLFQFIMLGEFVFVVAAIGFYFVLPIWMGIRLQRNGYPTWSIATFLSIFIGAGGIVAIVAYFATRESSSIKSIPLSADLNGLKFEIERSISRKSLAAKKANGIFLVVLFTVTNQSNQMQEISSTNFVISKGTRIYGTDGQICNAAKTTFANREWRVSLNPNLSKVMVGAFDVSNDVVERGSKPELILYSANKSNSIAVKLQF